MFKKTICAFVLLFIFNSNTFAAPKASLESALKTADEELLYEQADWQHLMQYIDRALGSRSSEIQSKSSFFAKDGHKNPRSELLATITAMHKPASSYSSNDDHPRCKFIARYTFLSQFITFPDNIKNLECVKFNDWINTNDLDSISLIFASGYFKNPASFYGHPLLKFNSKKNNTSSLLDITINNGAIVPPNENPILYMVKGVFGGYDAAFSDTKFYQLNHDYSESDLRDLWEYELNLSEEQRLRVALYSWELLGQRFTYRFFQQNCGYFLEDLLQYALKKRISPRHKLYTLPATTFFNLVETKNNGQALVKKITRTPSRHTQLYEKFFDLSEHEKVVVKEYIKTGKFALQVSDAEQLRAIDTLVDYYSFLISKNPKSAKNKDYIVKRTALYGKRLSLNTTQIAWPKNITTTPPHSGSRPTLLRIGAIHNSELGDGIKIRLRPASYDLIDLDDGHVPNSTLNMFNIEAVSINGKQRLTRFDLVEIKTLNLSRTGLPGDGGLGWGLRVGAERAELSCLDCLVAQASGSLIKGKKINENWTVYSELEATYHSNYEDRSFKATGLLGIVGQITPQWKTQLLLGQRAYIDGDNQRDSIVKWSNRFGNNTRSNFVLDIDYDSTLEAQLSYGYYW